MNRLFLMCGAVLLTSSAVSGQSEIQMRARQQPGWDVRAREGRCEIRVWVDNRAEVRLRGDTIFVRTLEGSKGRDEGSSCSQPIPYNGVHGFQIRQTAGRNRVTLAQEPERGNNYTAMVAINDAQGGGDNYVFEVTWQAEPNVAAAPAPFFDDVRAGQDTVRARFQSQNGRGAYIDFDAFADRRGENQSQNGNRDMGRDQGQGRHRGQESIQGRGSARSFNESRELTYSCLVDTRQNQVLSGNYQYSSAGLRTNDRRQLR
jgi:hypothetical protein